MHSPYKDHHEAVHRILRYLKATHKKGLFFEKTNDKNVSIFTNVDRMGSIKDRKSDLCYCTMCRETQ